MATSSKRAYDIPKSATPRATALAAGHCCPISLQETLKHSKAGLSQSLWGILVCTRFCLSPLSISGGYGSLLTQDDGVEECVLIFSCKNSKIPTRCWTTIDRRMLDPTKKNYLTSKGKRRSPRIMVGGSKFHLELNPIPARHALRAQTKSCAHQDWE